MKGKRLQKEKERQVEVREVEKRKGISIQFVKIVWFFFFKSVWVLLAAAGNH